jgi:hypothetical protein
MHVGQVVEEVKKLLLQVEVVEAMYMLHLSLSKAKILRQVCVRSLRVTFLILVQKQPQIK